MSATLDRLEQDRLTQSGEAAWPRAVTHLDNGRLMTPEEFDAIEEFEDGYAYELIHGVLVVNAAPGPIETDPNELLGHLLRTYAEQHPGVIDKTVYEQYLRVSNGRRRVDRVVWIGLGRIPKWRVDVPAIAVEFLSAGTRSRVRDYVEKRAEYLAVGVKEYWLFDRFRRQLTVFSAAGEQRFTAEQIYTTPLLPEFALPVGTILACADDWVELETEDDSP